jgi:hypothetical protein
MTVNIASRKGSANTSDCPTVIEFLLDETGSMSDWHGATVCGFNAFTKEQQTRPDRCLLTLTKFDTSGLKTPYADIDVNMVPLMTMEMFCPGASTNLRDAIIERASSLEQRLSSWTVRPNVLMVVLTDGDDNASNRSENDVCNLIKAKEAEGWTFVYLGATSNARQIASRLGFQPGNSKQFKASEMENTMTNLARATTAFRAGRAETKAAVASGDFFNAR